MDQLSFLFESSSDLEIINSYWYDPPYLRSPYQQTLLELTVPDDHDQVLALAQAALANPGTLQRSQFRLLSPDRIISLCLEADNDKILVLGVSADPQAEPAREAQEVDLLHRFMGLLLAADPDFMTH